MFYLERILFEKDARCQNYEASTNFINQISKRNKEILQEVIYMIDSDPDFYFSSGAFLFKMTELQERTILFSDE